MAGKNEREGVDSDPLSGLNGYSDLVAGLLPYHKPLTGAGMDSKGVLSGSIGSERKVSTVYEAGMPLVKVTSIGGKITEVKVYSKKSKKKR